MGKITNHTHQFKCVTCKGYVTMGISKKASESAELSHDLSLPSNNKDSGTLKPEDFEQAKLSAREEKIKPDYQFFAKDSGCKSAFHKSKSKESDLPWKTCIRCGLKKDFSNPTPPITETIDKEWERFKKFFFEMEEDYNSDGGFEGWDYWKEKYNFLIQTLLDTQKREILMDLKDQDVSVTYNKDGGIGLAIPRSVILEQLENKGDKAE